MKSSCFMIFHDAKMLLKRGYAAMPQLFPRPFPTWRIIPLATWFITLVQVSPPSWALLFEFRETLLQPYYNTTITSPIMPIPRLGQSVVTQAQVAADHVAQQTDGGTLHQDVHHLGQDFGHGIEPFRGLTHLGLELTG